MDPVVSQFLLGAIVPGGVSTLALGALWWGTPSRRARPAAQSPSAATDAVQAAVSQPILARLRPAAVPVLVALAVGFAQSAAVANGWMFPPVDAYSWLGTFAIIAAVVGCLSAVPRSPVIGSAVACIGVAAALPAAAFAAKLGLLDGAVVVIAGLVLFAGLHFAFQKPGLTPAVFLWLLLVTCSQTLILAFSSLRLGVLVHALAAVAGGAMVAAIIWPRLRIGIAGAAAISIIVCAVFAQAYSLGADSAPLWVRLGAMALLLLSPLTFTATSRLLRSRTSPLASPLDPPLSPPLSRPLARTLDRPLIAALVSLALAAIPAAAALAMSAWAYLTVADSPY